MPDKQLDAFDEALAKYVAQAILLAVATAQGRAPDVLNTHNHDTMRARAVVKDALKAYVEAAVAEARS